MLVSFVQTVMSPDKRSSLGGAGPKIRILCLEKTPTPGCFNCVMTMWPDRITEYIFELIYSKRSKSILLKRHNFSSLKKKEIYIRCKY